MIEPHTIFKTLGGKKVLGADVQSSLELADLVHKGFPVETVEYVVDHLIISRQELFQYVVSPRTYSRRRTEKRLSYDESDKLARFVRLRCLVADVIGEDETDKWLREPNALLNNKTPLYYLDSDSGAQTIESLLGRMAHGIVS